MRAGFPYRDLVIELVKRELKVRYRRSFLGFLWTMLQPLLMMLVLDVAFSTVFRFQVENYPIYVLAGLLFWNFFQQGIIAAMNSLRGNAGLIQKLPVPMAIFPLAAVCSGAINLIFALLPLLVLLMATGHPLHASLIFLPVPILLACLFTLGAGLLLAPLAVFFADVVEFIGVILQLTLFLTPVFYPMTIVPERWKWIVRYNPIRSVLEVFRDPIYFGKIPPASHLTVALAVALLALAIGAAAFRRSSPRIHFHL
ncbi:MAG: ABC transporter permease [Thermoanaerobaculia bacterium]